MERSSTCGGARRGSAAALFVALLAHAAAAQEPLAIDDELLARIAAEQLPSVRAALGAELAEVHVRCGTRAEIADALAEENTPILGGAEAARSFGNALAPALLAKYCFDRDLVLVEPSNVARIARLLGMPELAAEPAVRAVVLHELVHAADDELHGIAGLFARCADQDAVRAINGVIEGHAQLVARDLAPELGCADGLATYTRAITAPLAAVAASGDAGMKLALEASSSFLTSSYVDGEAFFVALRRDGGAEAVRAAFRAPPADAVLIARPLWFLDPSRRPPRAYDVDPALAALVAEFPEDWSRTRQSVTPSDLRVALAPLATEEIDGLFADLRQARVQTVVNPRAGSQIEVRVFEFGNPAGATAFGAGQRRAQELRDATLKSGAFRVLAAEYEDLSAPDPDGWRCEKRVAAGVVVDLTMVAVRRGPLAIEAIATSFPQWDGDRLLEAAVAALDEIARHPRPAEQR